MNQKPDPPRLSKHELENLPPGFFQVGGPVDRVAVSLRISGDTLDPDEITKLLGHSPTDARRKGEVLPDKRYHRVADTGSWHLCSNMPETVAVGEQVDCLLNKLTGDLEIWSRLADTFDLDVFCGLFFHDWARGFELSPATMLALSNRKLRIGFDIYCCR